MRGFSRFILIAPLCLGLFGAAALLLATAWAVDPHTRAHRPFNPADLTLRLTANTTDLFSGEQLRLTTRIENHGAESVMLCLPGEGSECGWRTPVVGWSDIGPNDWATPHPSKPPLSCGRDCGNIGGLMPEQFCTLKPGESREILVWNPRIAYLPGHPPGTYRLRFYYLNDPGMPWQGTYYNEPRLSEMLGATAKCSLVSNELIVRIEGHPRRRRG